jgi:hypothetical protein
LLTKNLRTKQLNKGLDYIRVRLFFIKEQSRPINYILDLLKDARIHRKFYVKILELADLETLIQKTFRYKLVKVMLG